MPAGFALAGDRQVAMNWLRALFRPRATPPRELVFVPYAEGDRMLRDLDAGWRLAPEEDRNRQIGMVYLERARYPLTTPGKLKK